MPILDIGYSG